MPVPITAIEKDYLPAAWKYKIRLTGKAGVVLSISIAQSMQCRSYPQLEAGILRADKGHPRAARRRRQNVHLCEVPRLAVWVFGTSSSLPPSFLGHLCDPSLQLSGAPRSDSDPTEGTTLKILAHVIADVFLDA